MAADNKKDIIELKWDMKVPIFKNSLILKQLFIAIGIPFGILIIFLFFIKAYEGLIIIAATFVLTFILVRLLYKGTYDVNYLINKNEIICETQKEQKKKVDVISKITFLLGVISNNPSVAGAGLLSGINTKTKIEWERIKKVKINEKHKYFLIYGGFNERISLFCSEENFDIVKKYFDGLIK